MLDSNSHSYWPERQLPPLDEYVVSNSPYLLPFPTASSNQQALFNYTCLASVSIWVCDPCLVLRELDNPFQQVKIIIYLGSLIIWFNCNYDFLLD